MRYTWNNTRAEAHQNWRDWDINTSQKALWTSIDLWETQNLVHSFDAWEGLFKAPITGDYRFTISCDDRCTFKMSLDDKLNP